jgi:hypothetical protein
MSIMMSMSLSGRSARAEQGSMGNAALSQRALVLPETVEDFLRVHALNPATKAGQKQPPIGPDIGTRNVQALREPGTGPKILPTVGAQPPVKSPPGPAIPVSSGIGQSPPEPAGHRMPSQDFAMPHLTTDDGVKLSYHEVGSGIPIVFVHEFAGNAHSWEGQLRHFGRRYRAIAYNARGYPPSDVPAEVGRYSQARARDDIRAVLDALNIDKAHIVGLSMGGFATTHFGFTYPDRARSLVIAGCGYGASPGTRAQFTAEAQASAARFEQQSMAKAAEAYALGPSRVQHQNKWAAFVPAM